jgi:acyl-coenzyme A synthetase/AMP-(fatty) acid ligase
MTDPAGMTCGKCGKPLDPLNEMWVERHIGKNVTDICKTCWKTENRPRKPGYMIFNPRMAEMNEREK